MPTQKKMQNWIFFSDFHKIGLEERCGCPVPCGRKFIGVTSWRSKQRDFNFYEKDAGFAYFNVKVVWHY